MAVKHAMFVMLLILQRTGSDREWAAVGTGNSCLGCFNLDYNYSEGRRSPSLIQLYQSYDFLAKHMPLAGCMRNTKEETGLARGLSGWTLAVKHAHRKLKKTGLALER